MDGRPQEPSSDGSHDCTVVASFNNLMWIVAVWDCAFVHLNQDVFTHARRLSILVLFVPAGLTHRLQMLDVYMYAFLKRRVREHVFGFKSLMGNNLIVGPSHRSLWGDLRRFDCKTWTMVPEECVLIFHYRNKQATRGCKIDVADVL